MDIPTASKLLFTNTLCVTVLLCTLNVHNNLLQNTYCNSLHPVL